MSKNVLPIFVVKSKKWGVSLVQNKKIQKTKMKRRFTFSDIFLGEIGTSQLLPPPKKICIEDSRLVPESTDSPTDEQIIELLATYLSSHHQQEILQGFGKVDPAASNCHLILEVDAMSLLDFSMGLGNYLLRSVQRGSDVWREATTQILKSSPLCFDVDFSNFDLRVSVRFGSVPFSDRSIREVLHHHRDRKEDLPDIVTLRGIVTAVSPISEKTTSMHFCCLNLHCPMFNVSHMSRDLASLKQIFCDRCGSQLSEDLAKRAHRHTQKVIFRQPEDGIGHQILVSLSDELVSLGWLGVSLTGTLEKELLSVREGDTLTNSPLFVAHSLAFGSQVHSPFPNSFFSPSIRTLLLKKKQKKHPKSKGENMPQLSPVTISNSRCRVALNGCSDFEYLFKEADRLGGAFSSNLRGSIFEHTAEIINQFGDSIAPCGVMDELKLLLMLSLIAGNPYGGTSKSHQPLIHLLIRGPCGLEVERLCTAASQLSQRACCFRSGLSLAPSVSRLPDGAPLLYAGELVTASHGVMFIPHFSLLKRDDSEALFGTLSNQSIQAKKMTADFEDIPPSLATLVTVWAIDECPSSKKEPSTKSQMLSRNFILSYDCNLDEEYDDAMAYHILMNKLDPSNDKKDKGFEILREVMEDKEKHPEMGEQCRALLSAYWIAIRKAAPMANQYGIKSFESLVTLATAHARLGFRDTVEVEDALVAILLFENSKLTHSSLLPFHSKNFFSVYANMEEFYSLLRTALSPLQSVIRV